MKARQIFMCVALLGMGLVGCKNNGLTVSTPIESDSVEYKSEGDSVLLCHVIVDFPTGHDSFSVAVADYINKELKNLYLPESMQEEGLGSVPQFKGDTNDGKAVINFYGKANYAYLQAEAKQLSEEFGASVEGMAYDVSIRKIEDNPRYLTYVTSCYTYLGGAHGSSASYATTIAKPSGKVITQTVDALKLTQMQPILRRGVISYMHRNGDTNVTDQNLNDYLFVDNGILPIPAKEPYLAADGLHFVYQQYEIGPYAMGMPEFVVPYEEAESFMTTESLELIKQ